MTKRSTAITLEGRTWTVELLISKSRHECPRIEIEPTDDPEARHMYAYKLGTEWYAPGYTEPSLAAAIQHAVRQLEDAN